MKKIFFILAILSVVSVYGWYSRVLSPVDSGNNEKHIVTIQKGMTTQGIAAMLVHEGMIRSARGFALYTRLHGQGALLQAGQFVLSPSMDVSEIIAVLHGKLSAQSIITIPEGLSVRDIDQLLASKGLSKQGEVIACAKTCAFEGIDFLPAASAQMQNRVEGYLFPETYFVVMSDFSPEHFLERLLQTFKKRVIEDLAGDLKNSKHSLHEIITMASLIEEEAKSDDERPMVAGILWKRFDAKVGLAVDAAIRYALEKKSGALTKDDLDVDSPYNTRRHRGLPPGPIANPGLKSILAALHPKDSPYWYYLHDRQGMIHYAVTNDEHNENKNRYLR